MQGRGDKKAQDMRILGTILCAFGGVRFHHLRESGDIFRINPLQHHDTTSVRMDIAAAISAGDSMMKYDREGSCRPFWK